MRFPIDELRSTAGSVAAVTSLRAERRPRSMHAWQRAAGAGAGGVLAVAAGLVAASVALTVLFIHANPLFHLFCLDTMAVDVPSPDERYVARAVERNCGATTRYNTIVSVRVPGTARLFVPTESVHVLAYEGRPWANGRLTLRLEWLDRRTLLVEYQCATRRVWDGPWHDVTFVFRHAGAPTAPPWVPCYGPR